jgi:hypothetical protein
MTHHRSEILVHDLAGALKIGKSTMYFIMTHHRSEILIHDLAGPLKIGKSAKRPSISLVPPFKQRTCAHVS